MYADYVKNRFPRRFRDGHPRLSGEDARRLEMKIYELRCSGATTDRRERLVSGLSFCVAVGVAFALFYANVRV